MKRPLKEGLGWAAALAAALPAFLFPLYNPDVFWHLSAGRWMVEHAALPRVEFLSFSLPGRAWLDFEWLSQLLFYGAWSAGRWRALWTVKLLLMAGCWRALDRALARQGASSEARALALGVWGVSALSWADARPELFSLLFFTIVLGRLEDIRADRAEPGLKTAGLFAPLFAVWASLHAGFPFALTTIAIYAVGELIRWRPNRALRTAALGLVGAVAALLNPYGFGPYRVAYEHFLLRDDLARYIAEWHPMSGANPIHWPFYAALVLCVLAAGARLAEPYEGTKPWTRPVPWAPLLLCGHLGANALLHARVSAFFGVAAALFLALVFDEARGAARKAGWAALAACVLFAAWLSPRLYWKGFFNDKFVPTRAAEFMARQEPALAPLRLFNQWEWGGFLAWRLRPWYRVFADGRYVFHELLREQSIASESPEKWAAFMDARRLNGALVPNRASFLPATRRYPDGAEKTFRRPWYLSFFPRDRWALVYWDEKALLFVERADVPKPWLAAREYRWLRPRDEEAFADAKARGEIPLADWDAERRRHAAEAE